MKSPSTAATVVDRFLGAMSPNLAQRDGAPAAPVSNDAPTGALFGDGRVLVLDVGFAPITVVGWQRAVTLLLDAGVGVARAEAVVEREAIISSPSVQVFLPSVIRLLDRSVPIGRRRVALARKRAIHERDRWTCAYCGWRARSAAARGELTVDHIHPRSRGGATAEHLNLVSACRSCNGRKGDRTPEEARMPLLFPPREPSWHERTMWSLVGARTVPADWAPFLAA